MLSVWTQPELDMDMDAVAARETVTETVSKTVRQTVTARETMPLWLLVYLASAGGNDKRRRQLATGKRVKMLQACC